MSQGDYEKVLREYGAPIPDSEFEAEGLAVQLRATGGDLDTSLLLLDQGCGPIIAEECVWREGYEKVREWLQRDAYRRGFMHAWDMAMAEIECGGDIEFYSVGKEKDDDEEDAPV